MSASRPGSGYFRNAGATQRLGLELALHGEVGPVRFYASYTLLRATFEEALTLPGAAHPAAQGGGDDDEGGVIEVEPGDRSRGSPRTAGRRASP